MELDNIKTKLLEIDQKKDYSKYEEMRKFLADNGVDVIRAGGANLGRCYNAQYFEVACLEQLPNDFISFLRKIGLLGCGQEFLANKPVQENGKWVVYATSKVDSSD